MSVTGGPNIITNGLLIHLDAASTKSYPGTGTSWFDLSGNNNTATLNNSQTYSSGNGGHIINNNNQNISITQNTAINNHASDYTYEIVFRPPSQSTYTYPRIFANCNYLQNGINLVGTSNPTDITFGFSWYSAGTSYGPTGITVAYNQWYHCFLSRIGGNYYTYYFYPNTVVTNTGALTFDLSNTNGIRIGANASGSETMLEHVALFRRYNIGLTYDQVMTNFSATRGRFGI